jgi:CxxC-x17-CxxC domain-containing protein
MGSNNALRFRQKLRPTTDCNKRVLRGGLTRVRILARGWKIDLPTTSSLRGVGVQYADKTITCRDCNATFVFTSGEQEFYASRGFDNPPSRCPSCRAARKAERSNSFGPTSYASSGGFATAPRREMFVTTCASCNGEARVPFQPRGDKPVYCSDCFETQRGASRPPPRGTYR